MEAAAELGQTKAAPGGEVGGVTASGAGDTLTSTEPHQLKPESPARKQSYQQVVHLETAPPGGRAGTNTLVSDSVNVNPGSKLLLPKPERLIFMF